MWKLPSLSKETRAEPPEHLNMGQKTHPFGFRVGITEAHKSRWFAPKALFGELLVEDYRIRKYVDVPPPARGQPGVFLILFGSFEIS